MIPDLIMHPEISLNFLIFLFWQTLKASVIFGAGYLVVALRRRATAAHKDLILRLVVAATVALPLLSLCVPQWDMALGSSIGGVWQTGIVTYNAGGTVVAPVAEQGFFAAWPFWTMFVWIAGTLLIMLHLGLGLVATGRIIRGGRRVTDPGMLRMADTLRQRLHIGRQVRMVVSSRVTTPFTWGTFRPTIILPATVRRWRPREIRFVLLHELAHIKRYDTFWYVLASLSAAMYWFNPFVWIVKKRLIIESEKTCDDYVICSGSDGMAYAQHLLDVLRTLRPGRSVTPIGVGMARRSHMEGRLMSILSDRQRSTTLRRSLVIWGTAVTLLLVLPMAGLTLSAAEQAKEKKAEKVDSAGEKLPAPDEFIPVDSGPTLTHQQPPEYPKEARKEGLKGTVMVKALIDKDGKVRKAVIDKSSGHKMLDEAALKAAYLNEYKPAMQKDKPVSVWVVYNVDFKLDGKKKESTGG